jgi:hypothetical protein
MKTKSGDKNIKRIYKVIANSLFKTTGKLSYTRLLEGIHLLCTELLKTKTSECVYSTVGESEEASLGDLLIGTYWYLSDWHGGQDSLEYRTLCSIGRIYSPGMASGPEEDVAAYECWEIESPYTSPERRSLLTGKPIEN